MPHSILNHCQDCQAVIASYWVLCYDCRLIKAAAKLAKDKASKPRPAMPLGVPADVLGYHRGIHG
jgi:hypothetical protein